MRECSRKFSRIFQCGAIQKVQKCVNPKSTSAKEEGRAKESCEESGNERTEKEGEIRRKIANHR